MLIHTHTIYKCITHTYTHKIFPLFFLTLLDRTAQNFRKGIKYSGMHRGIFRHGKVIFSLGFPITFSKPITSEKASLDYSVFTENESHAEYISRTNLDFHINALSDGQVRTT